MATVFTNGCFDVLHPGHYNLLMYCRELAGSYGKVIVAIDEDEKVMADKGLSRPIFSSIERGCSVSDLKFLRRNMVDTVLFFHTNLELEMLIKKHRPDIIVKGSDWKDRKVIGEEYAKVVFFERHTEHSTTDIVHRCKIK